MLIASAQFHPRGAKVEGLQREETQLLRLVARQELLLPHDVEIAGEELRADCAVPSAALGLHQFQPRFDGLVIEGRADQIGRAHVWTPVTNAHLVCRLLLEKKKAAILITDKLVITIINKSTTDMYIISLLS